MEAGAGLGSGVPTRSRATWLWRRAGGERVKEKGLVEARARLKGWRPTCSLTTWLRRRE